MTRRAPTRATILAGSGAGVTSRRRQDGLPRALASMEPLASTRRRLRDRRHAGLLDRARRGESDAFAELFRDLLPPVRSYLMVRAPTPQDAEDLVSFVFHRFVERLDDFDRRRGSVLGWLLTIAHHALVDLVRRTRPTLPDDDLADSLASPAPGAIDQLLRTERDRRLHRLLERLPAETRSLFVLRFEQDLRYRDIALRVGSTEQAVKQRFSRALRQLRRWLLLDADDEIGGTP